MDTDIPTFERCEVAHSDLGPVQRNSFHHKRLAKRRCELEQDMNDRLRAMKQTRGLLRSHSIFLERKSQLCFYGYHFKDSVKKDMDNLSEEEVQELSDYLFRFKYIVPVMKFVNEMSPTTVFYRYASDERRLAPSLVRERVSSAQLAHHLMTCTTDRVVAGNRLLELLDDYMEDWSIDLVHNQQYVMKQRNRLTMLCQQMLHHGNLIPESGENPERSQKFRPENRYYLCDSEEARDEVRQTQEAKMQRTRNLSDNARALGSPGMGTLRVRNSSSDSSSSACTLFQASTFRRTTRPKERLRRSSSVKIRKTSKANLYWTMDIEGKTNAEMNTPTNTTSVLEQSEIAKPDTREMNRQLSSMVMVAEVEIVDAIEDIQTYAPPKRKSSFPEKLRMIYKKLTGVKHKIDTSCNGNLNVSSIDAEWSVY